MKKLLHIVWLIPIFVACQNNSTRENYPVLSAELKPFQNKPTIFINEEPESPFFYALTDVPGGRWSWEEVPQHNLKNFCEAGVRLFQLDIFLAHLWKEDGSFSVEQAQKQINGLKEVCPDAAVVFRFHVNAPKWWVTQHPEEQVKYDSIEAVHFDQPHLSRLVQDDPRIPIRSSMASEKWKQASTEKLKLFCEEFSKTAEGNALIGLQLAGGIYGEWHQWGFMNNEADFSAPMLDYFKNWLKKKYETAETLQDAWNDETIDFEQITIPTTNERAIMSAGLFRDPAKDQKVIDYYKCQHELVADNIIHFCKILKDAWPRPILAGTFYGYYFSLFNRQAAGGHLALQKVLKSEFVDYLSGPQVYYPDAGYTSGQPARARSLIHSVVLNGKLWLDEYDQQPKRTFPMLNGKDHSEQYKTNMQHNVAQMRRNVQFSLSKGAGLWFYDFGPSGMNLNKNNEHNIQSGTAGYWDDPIYWEDIKKLKTLADRQLHNSFQPESDVLVVYDTDIFYHLKSVKRDTCPLTHHVVDWLPLGLYYSGVVFDPVHLDDLDEIDFSQYKTVIFANTWLLEEKDKKLIQEKVARDGRHLLWLYAPGYANGKTVDISNVKEMTGFDLEKVELADAPEIIFDKTTSINIPQEGWGTYEPLFAIADEQAEIFGHYSKNKKAAFGRKSYENHESWYCSVIPHHSQFFSFFFKEADVHRYVKDGIVYNGNGVLTIHFGSSGKKEVQLKNGRKIELEVKKAAATIFLDGETGRELLR